MASSIIGIAGLPGSGKSRLMEQLKSEGYSLHDDINANWDVNLPKAREEAQGGLKVAVSDIMFCEASFRERLMTEIGLPVQWICMENDRWQCAKNCLFRYAFEKPHRPLQREIELIRYLSSIYSPFGDIRPVVKTDGLQLPSEWALAHYRVF